MDVLVRVPDLLSQLLRLLSPKERFVIERRFNLDHGKRATLEEIGQHFKVTRERVRQIEKSALQKLRRNVFTTPLPSLYSFATEILKDHGGVMRLDLFHAETVRRVLADGGSADPDGLILALKLDPQYEIVGNTIQYHPYIRLQTLTDNIVIDVSERGFRLLEEHGDVVPREQFFKQLISSSGSARGTLSNELITSILHLDKRVKVLPNGFGLFAWRHIHPRTLRDKIFFVLRTVNKPLHFVEIANRIIALHLDQKRVNLQAVHNELIRCADFILIGRGIYALCEWGYHPGTVRDVIEDVLKAQGELDQEQIVTSVLERRQVKRITILLALKNDAKFVRVGRKRYALAPR